MLSVFPEFLSYGLLGVFIIRCTIGLLMFYTGLMTVGPKKALYSSKIKSKKYPFPKAMPWALGLLEIITGIFLIIGFLTQIMIFVVIYIMINLIIFEKNIGRIFDYPNVYYILIILVSFSLLFLGPGFWAIDLPL